MKSRLIILMGLPRSGKSTLARNIAKELGAVNVCPDDIRMAMYGQAFIQSMEEYVWATAKTMFKALMLSGHKTVILDATSISRKLRDTWKKIYGIDYDTKVVFIDTKKETCIKRASDNGMDYLVPIIERMELQLSKLTSNELDDIDIFYDGKDEDIIKNIKNL